MPEEGKLGSVPEALVLRVQYQPGVFGTAGGVLSGHLLGTEEVYSVFPFRGALRVLRHGLGVGDLSQTTQPHSAGTEAEFSVTDRGYLALQEVYSVATYSDDSLTRPDGIGAPGGDCKRCTQFPWVCFA